MPEAETSCAIAYLNLGGAYARSSERDKARAAYQTYLEISPQGPQAVYAKQRRRAFYEAPVLVSSDVWNIGQSCVACATRPASGAPMDS